jgi:signal transduction histidine kinase/ligand-binding sensor domain-containing protein/CheY-like chemotaxis protein
MLLQQTGLRKLVYSMIFIWITLPFNASGNSFKEELVFNKIFPKDNSTFGIIEDIQQDSTGFIWIAAKDGLFRYDGIQFKAYLFDRRNPNSISNNVITDIFCGRDGKLWLGTENGLNLYDEELDLFTRFYSLSDDTNSISANHIVRMAEDKNGNLWVATVNGGLSQFNKKKKQFERYTLSDNNGIKITSNFLRTIYADSEGMLWVGTIDKGVFAFKPGESENIILTAGSPDGKHISGTDIRSIIEFPEGLIWFGSNKNGLSCYNKKTGKFTYYSTLSKDKEINSDAIWNLFLDSRKNLWISTDGGGLIRFDKNSGSFISYKNNPNDPGSISSDVIRVFYEDLAGNYWIGTFNSALNYIDTHRKNFQLLCFSDEKENEQGMNKITSILSDSHDKVWIGTDGGGLLEMDMELKKKAQFKHVDGDKNSICSNKPLCIKEDYRGNIWIGTYEGGLSCFSKKDRRFINYYPDGTDNNPKGTEIWALMPDSNKIWIGSEMGVEILDLNTMKFSYIRNTTGERGDFMPGTWSIYKDTKGHILFGTIEGLAEYDENNKSVLWHKPILNDTSSLSEKWVLSIFEDSHNRIWIGTNGGGLNLWHGDGRFSCISIDQGLPGNVINGILEDPAGALWISTNNGIARFYYDDNKIITYDLNDGIQENRFNINSAYKDRSGQMFFGGINGLNYFYPLDIEGNDHIPPVIITDFELFNKPVRITDPKSPVTKNMVFQDIIHLNYKQMVFTIRFAALNYTQPEENRYKYILDGFEDEWNFVGNQNWATYTNLPPGKYTFRVLGSNNDNTWNTVGTSLTIVVHSPFYRTFWFISLVVLLILLGIFIIYRLRVQDIQTLNKKLSQLVSKRTQELENRNLEILRQNDEIRKQVSIATNQRDQISKQNEELEKHRNQLEELVRIRTIDLAAAKLKAENSDRIKAAFLENLSHQIRTPMNAILGFINLLSEKIDDKNSRDYYMRIINDSGRSMLRLVEDIIDFSRMQTDPVKPEYKCCDVNRLIRDLVSIFRSKAARDKPGLNISMDLPRDGMSINTDERRLSQILMKLLENSYKYTDNGYIRVGIKSIDKKRITFFVEDTGMPIEEEHLSNIFDHLFFVPEDDKTTSSRGSGLDLAFAKTVTNLMGGEIRAEAAPEKTTCFSFTLPYLLPEENNDSGKKEDLTYYWPGKLIIVAEDEDSNFQLIEAILKDTGVKIIRANDGVHLLEIVETESKIDLVLLDIQMPRMSGMNAMQIIRDSNRNIPVIAQTAFDHNHFRKLAADQDFSGFIVKPIRKLELLDAIKKCLG